MSKMADRPALQTATFAFTLPISCQICLGKVKQPVVCPNQHVFCQQCMDVWLMHNQQCPTCRVEISVNNPCKRVLGGLSGGEETSDRDSFSTKEVRKARLDVIFNEYEREIERLQSLVEDLSRKNEELKQQVPNQPSTSGTKAQKGKGSDVDKLLQLTSKLQDATSTYEAVVRDMAKLKEENSILREKNSDLSRMNDQLRLELNKRTPQKYGRFTVATLEAKVAQYEKENAQLQRALERSDKYTEELETQLENYKKHHNLQNEQRISRERSKTPELNGEEKRPTERKWNQEKLDNSKEHHVSVSSSERTRLPDPKLSPISQTLQFLRNPPGGSNELVPSWLRTDQNWPEAKSGQPEARQNQQDGENSFVLEQPSPLTPATHLSHLSIRQKSEIHSQNRTDTHTSYKTEDTYNRRVEEGHSYNHSSRSLNNSAANVSSNQNGGNYVNNDRSARFSSPTGQSEESITSSGKVRRKLNLGNDGEKVRKSLFPSREANEKELTHGRYISHEVRDTSNSSNSSSWTDKASSTSNSWRQNRSESDGKKTDLDLYDTLHTREKSGRLANRSHSLPSEQMPKNYRSLVEKGRESSVLPGPSSTRLHAVTSLDVQDSTVRDGRTSQWQTGNTEGSDDEDREVASTTANQSLLDLDITLTPNMKDVYLMMKQAERRVGERREAVVEPPGPLHSSHDARIKSKHLNVPVPQETSRQKTGAEFESKPKMPRSNSAPVFESTNIRNVGRSGNISENLDLKSARRRNTSQSSLSRQGNSACGSTRNGVEDSDRRFEEGDESYTTDKVARNRSWDAEHAVRHAKANANSHPWAFRDSSSSFSTVQGNNTFSSGKLTQEQTRVPEIKKPMHPTMFECFGEGSSSGDRDSTDSDVGRYQYRGLLDRENEGESFKKRKARESYSASPTKSPKWK